MLLVEAQRPSESAAIVVDQKVAKIVAGAASEELKLKSAIIDGELVYPHKSGLSNFHALASGRQVAARQAAIHGVRPDAARRARPA